MRYYHRDIASDGWTLAFFFFFFYHRSIKDL